MNDTLSIADRVKRLTPAQLAWIASELREQISDADSQEQTELVAWVVRDAESPDIDGLRREIRQRLPSRLVPRRIVHARSIPRTSTGKIDRNRLAESLAGNRPGPSRSDEGITESELALIRICRSLLGVADISPKDNFFHIGGDSLSSIQLISRARQAGVEIEPYDVLHCSSIAELASAATRRLGKRAGDSGDDAEIEPVVSQVRSSTLTDSERNAGILMVHEVGGRCNYAHYLATDLAPKQSLFVCNQPMHEESPNTIEALAILYAEAWIESQPIGARIIIAFCWGGPLAYEIARQLKSRGHEILAVLIVESGTEASYQHAPMSNRMWDQMKGNWVRIRNRITALRSPAAIGKLCKTVMEKVLRRESPITADAGFRFREDEGDPEQIRSNVQAFLDYVIQPDSLPIHLFRVRGPVGLIGTRFSDATLGWRYLVGGNLRMTYIPGNHDTCMQPPHVSALAQAMNHVIGRLESSPISSTPPAESLS